MLELISYMAAKTEYICSIYIYIYIYEECCKRNLNKTFSLSVWVSHLAVNGICRPVGFLLL